MDTKKFGEWMAILFIGCIMVLVFGGTLWVADKILDSMRAGC